MCTAHHFHLPGMNNNLTLKISHIKIKLIYLDFVLKRRRLKKNLIL